MIVFWNGEFIQDSEVKIPLTDAGYLSGYGVYDTMRTFEGKFMFLFDHMMRVIGDAKGMYIPLKYTYEELCEIVRELAKKRWEELGSEVDLRIRTTVTADGYDFFNADVKGANILMVAEELKEFNNDPVKATLYFSDYCAPGSKSTSRIEYVWPRRRAVKQEVFETIIIDGDSQTLREGTFTSVFVVKGMTLLAPSDMHVLSGIARSEIIDIAHDCMLVDIRDITLDELKNADEVFLAGSVRGIIPVTEIDGGKVGDGKVGPWTQKLDELFWGNIRKFRLE